MEQSARKKGTSERTFRFDRRGLTTTSRKPDPTRPLIDLAFGYKSFRVQLLQRPYVDFSPLQRGNALGGCSRRCQGGDGGNPRSHGSAANSFLVEPRLQSR